MRHNEKEFTERVREASDQNQEKTVKECKQKINKAQKRHKELDGLVKKRHIKNIFFINRSSDFFTTLMSD